MSHGMKEQSLFCIKQHIIKKVKAFTNISNPINDGWTMSLNKAG
jgi:hypothetical protein